MTICKFFLQGNCRFGQNCKFQHEINSDHNYTNNRNNPVPVVNKPAIGSNDINTFIRAIVNDMLAAANGKQWLLSSYTPFKEKSSFPGFEDQSFEEVRYGFYESSKSGGVDIFKQNFQAALQQSLIRMKALENPNSDIIEIIKKLYGNQSSSNNQNINKNLFGNVAVSTSSASGFVNQGMNSIANPATTNIFGNSTNHAAQMQANQIIAAQAQQSQNVIYGNNSTIFGGNPGNQNNAFVAPSMFAVPQQMQPTSQQQSTAFVSAQPQQQQPMTAQNFSFVQNVPVSAAPPANNNSTNIFNNAPPIVSNVFGNSAINNQNRGVFTQGGVVNSEAYSKIDELSKDDLEWFESGADIMKIPELPPSYDMCFKSA